MPRAEHISTVGPNASLRPRSPSRRKLRALLAVAWLVGVASSVVVTAEPAAANQISSDKAEASAISAKLQGIQAQEQALSGQVEQADYQLSQIQSEISANQAKVVKDQAAVDRDVLQLRTEAIASYTSSGESSQATVMFSSNVNVSGIRSEYTSIANGNVTTVIDRLHSAQSQLQAAQSTLKQQSSRAVATRDGLQSAENQSAALLSQYNATLNSVNSQIQTLVAAQQAAQQQAAAAAAKAAFTAQVAASQQAQAGSQPRAQIPTGSAAGGAGGGGGPAPGSGPPPSLAGGAAGAVQAAESQLGVPYVWGGETPGVAFDCSGLVQWAYSQVGISLPRTSGAQFGATIQIPLSDIQPGDLLFYGPGGSQHVAMYVGGGMMIEAPAPGLGVHITPVRTGAGFAGVGRVQ